MKLARTGWTIVFLIGLVLNLHTVAAAITLSETPASVTPGGTAKVTWIQVANPTTKDWIGVYKVGTADTSFIDWVYTPTCTRTPGFFVFPAGSCDFKIGNSVANGTYEFRYYTNDSFTRLATSNQFLIAAARFVDNGDGTISDLQTGYMWEKKEGPAGNAPFPVCPGDIFCEQPHATFLSWVWSLGGARPDGSLFNDFLTSINRADGLSSGGATSTRKNYTDWRIPTLAELRTIVDCTKPNCLDPVFGPTGTGEYWTSSTDINDTAYAYVINFGDGSQSTKRKDSTARSVRAVRGGR